MSSDIAKKNNYPETRKAPVRLTDDEEYNIYKYAVENHCIAQVDDLFNFRVEPSTIAKEINLQFSKIVNGRVINYYHVKSSVEKVISWQKRLNKLPIQPIETAELEQLRIYKTKTMKEVEELKLAIAHKNNTLDQAAKEIERLKKPSDAQQKLERIRAIVSV